MNASFFLPPRRRWLARSLWFGLLFLLFSSSCVLEPFSLVDAPCAGDTNECVGLEVCVRGKCQLDGTPECSSNTDCTCGDECAPDRQVCFASKCTNDTQCKRAGCDYHCELAKGICINGPPPSPYCKSAADCNNQLCVDNRCKPCAADTDCQSTGKCDAASGKCVGCESNKDCAPQICDTAAKRCVPCSDHKECETQLCQRGVCTECQNDTDCPTLRCDTATKKCLPCQQNSDCPTNLCASPFCIKCQNDENCAGNGGNCSEDGVCTSKCGADSECGSNYCKDGECALCTDEEDCPSKICRVGRCAGPCNDTDNKCTSGRECDAGVCRRPGEGKACAPPLNCRAPFLCIDEDAGKVCRNVCDPLKPGCTNGQLCQFLPNSTNPSGICVSSSTGKAAGEVCDPQTAPCKVGLYCHKDAQSSTCRTLCDRKAQPSGCTATEICAEINSTHETIGVCAIASCGTAGNVCKSNEKCINKQCKKTCLLDTECDASEFCFDDGTNKFCKAKECNSLGLACTGDKYCDGFSCKTLSNFPKECTATSDCQTGAEYCIDLPGRGDNAVTNPKRCWKKCTSTPCSTGYHCVLADTGDGSKACFPKIGGGDTGAACSQTAFCESNQICTTALSAITDSRCLANCHPKASGTKCSQAGFECVELGRNDFGVCVNTGVTIKNGNTCGLHLGSCESGTRCFSSTGAGLTKPTCRRDCTGASFRCTGSFRCKTFTVRSTTFSVCLIP